MLTCKQALKLATRKTEPPWKFGDLPPVFGRTPGQAMSVKVFLNRVEDAKTLLFLEIRDMSIILESNGLGELTAKWETYRGASKATLEQIEAVFGARGGAVTFISPDRRSVAISGGMGNLIQVQGLHITDINWGPTKDIASGMGLVGAGVGLAGTLPGPQQIYLLAGGGVLLGAAGLTYIEAGIYDALTAPSVHTIDEVTVVGEVPQGVDSGNVVNAEPVNISDIPEEPPEEPAEGEVPDGGAPPGGGF
jgi:hypothetical protein